MLHAKEVLPGVYHIQDALSVCMTLLVGEKRALLVDTGYGLEDVHTFVRSITPLPLTVVLTHGHHDHCMGVRWFRETWMFPEDTEDFRTYTSIEKRRDVLTMAEAHGVVVGDEEAFLREEFAMPAPLQEQTMDLGGITAQILHCPGHTPGSCVVLVRERSLLLTGDDWNPCTWLFFPRALGVRGYRRNVRALLSLSFRYVLCSHQPVLFPRSKMECFLNALTDKALCAARPVRIAPYTDIQIRQCTLPEGQVLVFDWQKFVSEERMNTMEITIHPEDRASFQNHTAYCVGTGRMGLALHQEYQAQLRAVQELCHFAYIRGHGLFHDDMAIYQCRMDADGNEQVSYNFTYLDRVMDSYVANGLEPFLELGFMPEKLATSDHNIFYWKGHTTPPKSDEAWCALVQATLRHLMERYGAERVTTWPLEVWNEPNLAGFWENADKPAYMHLYEVTVKAVKAVSPRFQVGGPAICGGSGSQEWVRDFLTFCQERQLPVDFVTRHAYMGQSPERHGRYLYHTMCAVDYTVREMRETRDIIDRFPAYRGIPMHITEFNTSYNSRCPIHDTVYNAVLMAEFLSKMGDVADSYSYWTFGDVFEEEGVPFTPFHGGFGLMADGLIPKPTLWTFAWFSGLKGQCVYRDDHALVMQRPDGSYEGVVWNADWEHPAPLPLRLTLPAEEGADYAVVMERVADGVGDPLKLWHDLGEPASLTAEQHRLLQGAARPQVSSRRLAAQHGQVTLDCRLSACEVMHLTVRKAPVNSDDGYDYAWYASHQTDA